MADKNAGAGVPVLLPVASDAGQLSTDPIVDTLFNVSAAEIIERNLKDYIAAIVLALFPSPVDGQKKIIRRFLYAAADKSDRSIGRGQYKSEYVVAEVQKTHPFSPKSMYEALVRLSQPWCVNHQFIELEGNKGSYYEGEPAASRYTEMVVTDLLKAVFFRDIDLSVLPLTAGVSGNLEPRHFIPTIPMALVNDNLTIGYGYQSKTACLHLDDVCDLVSIFVEHQKTSPWARFPVEKYAAMFLPDFPTPCVLVNDEELCEAYKHRDFNAKIKMDGHVTFTNSHVIIESLPHSQSFSPILGLVQTAIDSKSKAFVPSLEKKVQSVNILEPRNGPKGLYVEMKRGVNAFSLWRDLSKIVHISGTYVPNPNYVSPEGFVDQLDYINIIQIWYEARKSAILSTKRKSLQTLKERQWITEAEIIVIDHTDRVIEIARTYEGDARIIQLSKEFGITPFQSEALLSMRLNALGKSSALELQARLDGTKKAILDISASFNNVGEEISAQAQRIKKEFSLPRRMTCPKYTGCVYVDGGFIQFENIAEIESISEAFPRGRFDVEIYAGPYRIHLDETGKAIRGDLHKHSFGSIVSFKSDPNKSGYYTVSIRDGAACCVEGAFIAAPEENYSYVRRTAMGVTRKGELQRFDVKAKLSMRKTPGRGANTDLIHVFPDQTKPFFVVTLNEAEKNVIHLQKVDPTDTKMIMSPVGTPVILVNSTGRDWFVSFPESYSHRIGSRCFCIKNADALLNGAKQVKLDVGTPKVKKNPNIVGI